MWKIFLENALTFLRSYITIRLCLRRKEVKRLGIKKGTKLTDNPKDYMLRVRMDSNTVEKLDACCEKQGLTRSEVVRKGIQEQFDRIKK